MNRSEYEKLMNVKEKPLTGADLSDPYRDRTMLSGYTSNRDDFRVELENGELVCYWNDKRSYDESTVRSDSEYVPNKRVYADESDFEFCKLLLERGVNITFTLPGAWRQPADFS